MPLTEDIKEINYKKISFENLICNSEDFYVFFFQVYLLLKKVIEVNLNLSELRYKTVGVLDINHIPKLIVVNLLQCKWQFNT